jgi:transcriptional regulator with GAF, ATPase, and Fis domain
LESELFGHVKGAYTGAAQDKVGRFQLADGGSIFLDEIGDVSPKVQLKLLAFLQEHEFERVGDHRPIKVDVRIIAATNQDLEAKVQSGEFRQDLYFRLKVVQIYMPPLRERPEDIPLLIEHYRIYFNQKFKKEIQSITSQVLYCFQHYPWPGNVRELMHAMEHAFVICKGKIIYLECLPPEMIKYLDTELSLPEKQNIATDYQNIYETLQKTDWNKAKAARMLGISRQTLYKKIKNLGISSS